MHAVFGIHEARITAVHRVVGHVLALDAVVVKPDDRAVNTDSHFGDVGVEVFFRLSASCRIGLNKKQ